MFLSWLFLFFVPQSLLLSLSLVVSWLTVDCNLFVAGTIILCVCRAPSTREPWFGWGLCMLLHDNLQLTYSLPLQMKVRLLQSYVVDLSDQNNVLVQMMEELERETEWKVAALKAELQVLFAVHGCTKECALCSLGIIALCLQSIL